MPISGAMLEKEEKHVALDEKDIALLKTYGLGPYEKRIKGLEADITGGQKKVNDLIGIKESDTGLSPPSQWDLVADKQMMQEEQPLQVARCTKIIDAGQVRLRVWVMHAGFLQNK